MADMTGRPGTRNRGPAGSLTSVHRVAAVYFQDLPGDERGESLRREKQVGARALFGQTDPAQRDGVRPARIDLGRCESPVNVGIDHPGGNAVYPDTIRPQFACQPASETGYGGLARRIDHRAGRTAKPCRDRTRIDDGAVSLPAKDRYRAAAE